MNIGKNGSEIISNIVETSVKKATEVVQDVVSEATETKTVQHASSDISGTYNKAIAQIQSNTTAVQKGADSSVDELTELEKLFAKLEVKGKTTIKIEKEGDEIDVLLYKGKHHDYIKSPDGKIFRVRYSKDDELNDTIIGTAKQYAQRGFKVPQMMHVEINGKRGIASELMTDLVDKSTNPKALYEIFGTDVLFAQRQAYSKGTTMLDLNGTPVKVSTSGSCGYRVRGEVRPDFNEEITELRTFLDPNINPESAELFKDMTRADLLKSINRALDPGIGCTEIPTRSILNERHAKLKEFYTRAYHMPQEEGETILQYVTRVQNKITELANEDAFYTTKLREYVDSLGIEGRIHYQYNYDYKDMDAKECLDELIEAVSQSKGMAKSLYMRRFSAEELKKLAEYQKNIKPSSSYALRTIHIGASPEIASQILYVPNRATQCTFDEFVRFYNYEADFRPCKRGLFNLGVENNTLIERGLLDQYKSGEISFDDLLQFGCMRDEGYASLSQRGLTGVIEGRSTKLEARHLARLGEMSDERFAKITERGLLQDFPNRTTPLTSDDFSKLADISDENWERLLKFDLLNNIDENGTVKQLLTGDDISSLLKGSTDEQIQTAIARGLFDKKYEKVARGGYQISQLANLSDIEYNNVVARGLFADPKYKDYFEFDYLLKTASISKADEEIMNIFGIKTAKEFNGWKAEELTEIAKIQHKDRLQEIMRLNINDPSGRKSYGEVQKYLSNKEIIQIAKLPDEAYQRALGLLRNTELLEKNLKGESIANTVNCDEKTWETMVRRGFFDVNSKLADTKNLFSKGYSMNDEHPNQSGMVILSKIPDDKWDKLLRHNIISTNPNRGQLMATDIYDISRYSDEDFEKLLKTGIFDKDFNPTSHNGKSFGSVHLLISSLKEQLVNLSVNEIEKLAQKGFFGEMTSVNGKYIGDYSFMLHNDSAKIAASLTDEQLKLYRELADLEKYQNNYTNLRIAKMVSTPEQVQRLKDRELLYWSKHYEGESDAVAQLDILSELIKLTDEEWKYVRALMYDNGVGMGSYERGFAQYALTPGKNIANLVELVDGRKNIHEFSLRDKRKLLNMLIRSGGSENLSALKSIMPEGTIIPRTLYKRKLLINQLTESIGLKSKVLTEAQRTEFFETLGKISQKDSGIMSTNYDAMSVKAFRPSPRPTLLYSRRKFTSDIYEQVKDLPQIEQRKIFEYFSFEIEKRSDGLVLNGYPFMNKTAAAMHDIEDAKTLEVIERIRPLVDKFANGNKIFVEGNPKLEAELNKILEIFPEFGTTIGKVQHDTQDFTVDVHTLKVLQQIMSDPRFADLSDADKQVLQLSTILHDITKIERTVDKSHPTESAFDAFYLVDRLNLPRSEKLKIYEVIKNHDWLEQINKKIKIGENQYRYLTEKEKEIVANKIAFAHRQNDCFRMATILTKADLMGVKEGDSFYKYFEKAYNENVARIQKLIDKIKQTAIHIPQTRIPKASELIEDGQIVKTVKKDGITNKVIYLEPGQDLSKIGFDEGVTSDILNVIVHALDAEEQAAVFRALGLVDSDALLSASWVNYAKGNYKVFRGQGFVLKVDSDDIHAGTYKDFGSGFKKDYDTLLKEYIFGQERAEMRTYWADTVKKKFGFNTEEYMKFNDKIKNKPFEQIMKEDPETAIKIQEIVDEMDVLRRKGGRNYNEWLISRPEIQAGFFWGKSNGKPKTIDDVPLFIREYLAENDLPLIFFGA